MLIKISINIYFLSDNKVNELPLWQYVQSEPEYLDRCSKINNRIYILSLFTLLFCKMIGKIKTCTQRKQTSFNIKYLQFHNHVKNNSSRRGSIDLQPENRLQRSHYQGCRDKVNHSYRLTKVENLISTCLDCGLVKISRLFQSGFEFKHLLSRRLREVNEHTQELFQIIN